MVLLRLICALTLVLATSLGCGGTSVEDCNRRINPSASATRISLRGAAVGFGVYSDKLVVVSRLDGGTMLELPPEGPIIPIDFQSQLVGYWPALSGTVMILRGRLVLIRETEQIDLIMESNDGRGVTGASVGPRGVDFIFGDGMGAWVGLLGPDLKIPPMGTVAQLGSPPRFARAGSDFCYSQFVRANSASGTWQILCGSKVIASREEEYRTLAASKGEIYFPNVGVGYSGVRIASGERFELDLPAATMPWRRSPDDCGLTLTSTEQNRVVYWSANARALTFDQVLEGQPVRGAMASQDGIYVLANESLFLFDAWRQP